MLCAKPNKYQNTIAYVDWLISNGKQAELDLTILWIHELHSGRATHYDIPRQIYDKVSLAHKLAPTLFKSGIPSDPYAELIKVYKTYQPLKD